MADTVVIAEERAENSGYRFSWGLAIAGGVAATAVTFFLLSLGSGFGLLLVNPQTHSGPTLPAFLTGGAIYFLAAQAFGFAIGGHLAGRLLGPIIESRAQEEFRAEAHGFMVWAVAVVATVLIVALAGITAASSGAATAALYGASSAKTDATPTAYLVDQLFRPSRGPEPATAQNTADRAEAGRIVDAGLGAGMQPTPSDHARLADVVAREAGISENDAASRIDAMQKDLKAKAERAANIARKIASYTALWIGLSLIFGVIVSITAAMMAREEDDRQAI
ncbi:MAG TPA: hypothetical protein VG387_19965 [Rhizomicrobium sp.]|nr:hypothetical protein [Rhizomicrobium sp.]